MRRSIAASVNRLANVAVELAPLCVYDELAAVAARNNTTSANDNAGAAA